MFIRAVSAICVVLTIATLAIGLGSRESDSKTKLQMDLAATIHHFARQHKLTDDQAWRLVGELVMSGPAFKKGGVGTLGNNTYVFPDAKRNTLRLGQRLLSLKVSACWGRLRLTMPRA